MALSATEVIVVVGLIGAGSVLWRRWGGGRPSNYFETAVRTAEERAELISTAYHEAAHFVVLYALAPEVVGAVTIVPSDRRLGATFHAPLYPEQGDVAGVTYFAGFWGEVLSGVPQTKARVGAFGDMVKAAPLIAQFVDAQRAPGPISTVSADAPPHKQARGHYQAQALLRVTSLWGSVEAVASALLAAGTIDRDAAVRAFTAGKATPTDQVQSRLLDGWKRSQAGDQEIASRRASKGPLGSRTPP